MELEYIESTGTQYIDTGFKPTIYTSIETVFSTKASTTDTNLFGSRVSGSVQDYTIWINTSSNKGIACHFPIKSGSAKDTKWVYTGNIIDTPTKLLITPENIKVNDELVYTFDDLRTEYTANNNAYIFTKNENGNSVLPGSFKVFYFKIWDKDILIRNFIPCYRKADDAVGMFDTVSNVFYENKGTGEFKKGTEIVNLPEGYTQLEYIESTGTQYIDTGYTNNTPKTGYYIKYQNSKNHSGDDVIMGVLNPNRCLGVKNLKAVTYWKEAGTGFDGSTSVPILQSDIVEAWLNYKNNNKRQININEEMSTLEDVSNVTTTNNLPCLIFGASYGNIVYGRSNGLRVFSAKISENNELVRDFIPCYRKSDGEIGLYDLVENKFYSSNSETEFIAGNEIVKKQ